MKFESSRIIDSNGQPYRVGWDAHGWFSIDRVERHPETEELVSDDSAVVSFPMSEMDALQEAIDDR